MSGHFHRQFSFDGGHQCICYNIDVDLSLHGIDRSTPKGFYFKVLLYPFEELVKKKYSSDEIEQAFVFANESKPVTVGLKIGEPD